MPVVIKLGSLILVVKLWGNKHLEVGSIMKKDLKNYELKQRRIASDMLRRTASAFYLLLGWSCKSKKR
jgi:hypothetical protein